MFDAIVLAGGSARRLAGADKPAVQVGGTSMLERVVHAVRAADRVVVVGPQRPIDGVLWTCEQPAGGGPVAAIAAALPVLDAPRTVVLAADLPWIDPAVPVLLAALGRHDVVTLEGNPLAAAWSTTALRRALDAIGEPAGARARALLTLADSVSVPDPYGWGADCDTWDDVLAARARLGG